MSKVIIISNRLPVSVEMSEQSINYKMSIGGLATGLKSYHNKSDSIWVGWPGITSDCLTENEKTKISEKLRGSYKCEPVFLSEKQVETYYHGFCNKTIWPLFHYFTNKVQYDPVTWDAYHEVNAQFLNIVDPYIGENDTIWVHDYQLMLLPRMIKEKHPSAQVGFFLHIPFPSFEIFRLLIWREEILNGLLGADLIGFHTYDYVRHFVSCSRRLLGLDHNLNKILLEDRFITVDTFPMGIDYVRFSKEYNNDVYKKLANEIRESKKDSKVVLSIDRLDYSKGIPERIKAFALFLKKYPEYMEKVRLYLIVAPSRIEVDTYEELKKEITELVSEINGEYGTFSWMPIWFLYQSFPQESLIAFYRQSDVLLVTPLRDGMNLVAKEYVAARTDYRGMVVISETAGAASEMGEAVVVNPNDSEAIADSIKFALDMPEEDRDERNKIIHERLQRYNVEAWAHEFLHALEGVSKESKQVDFQNTDKFYDQMATRYKNANNRMLFLDYDGTLVKIRPMPNQAMPETELRVLLKKLTDDPKNTVVIVSGRDKDVLGKWLDGLNLHFLAGHGLWLKHPGHPWSMTISLGNEWKESVRNLLEMYNNRMPGSVIEEKEYALAFHYRQCDPDLVGAKLSEVREAIFYLTQSMNLGLQEGKKVIEIKDNRFNKGFGASLFLNNSDYDFVIGAGDDNTDEDLFSALPDDAYSIKIGSGNTEAKYHLKSWKELRLILEQLSHFNEESGFKENK